jgi:hypothetical protein
MWLLFATTDLKASTLHVLSPANNTVENEADESCFITPK